MPRDRQVRAACALLCQEVVMPIVNLKDYYLNCKEDVLVEVSDEVAEDLAYGLRRAKSIARLDRAHNAKSWSLDAHAWVEDYIPVFEPSAEQIVMDKATREILLEALAHIKPIQAQHIYKKFFLGMRQVEIAQEEGVTQGGVSKSIQSGLRKLEKYLYEQQLYHLLKRGD